MSQELTLIELLLKHSPALIVAIPLLGAFLTPLIGKINGKLRNIFVICILGLTGLIIAMLAYDVFIAGNIHTYIFGAENLNNPIVRIHFRVDAMSMFMATIGIILSFSAVVYSWAFMKGKTGLDKYYTLILLMTAGMLGMMLTGDMFNFFVFLEITSIASCALIAYRTSSGKAIEAGFKYIVISTIGALFFLFAVAILYSQYNALNMQVLADSIQYSFLDKIALVLIVSSLAMKAGLVPMHMWLPDAYGKAPAPVAVILVGATQASLYGVFRVCFTVYGNVFQDITHAGLALLILGILTMLVGVIMALSQNDFKRMIAFAAVAEIGYMFLGIGAGVFAMLDADPAMAAAGITAMKGGIFHIINDALDVGLLFLVAGAIYYVTKESSLNKLGGLARNMKYTTIFFIIGLLAVAGMPPMNGFASKLLIYESTFRISPLLAIVAILSSIMLLAVFVKVFYSAFMGPALPKFQNVKEVPKSMLVAMAIFAGMIIFFGLFPDLILTNIVEPAANALIGGI